MGEFLQFARSSAIVTVGECGGISDGAQLKWRVCIQGVWALLLPCASEPEACLQQEQRGEDEEGRSTVAHQLWVKAILLLGAASVL